MDGLDRIKTPKTREKLQIARDRIRQNRKMVELDCDLPLPVAIEDLRICPDYPRLIEAMERYEFKSLLEDVRGEAARAGRETQGELLL
jgi:DNA polymerase-1